MITFTSKQARERIEGLEAAAAESDATIAQLTSELDAAKADAANASEALVNAQTELAALSEAHETLTAERDELMQHNQILEGELTIANEALEKTPDLIEARAAEKLAAAGFAGDVPAGSTHEDDEFVKTRQQFNAMNPAQRTAFAKAGGQLK
jgi:chromosome segregation ATPase